MVCYNFWTWLKISWTIMWMKANKIRELSGYMWSSESRGEDRSPLHMAQQSKQPFCESEKGVQRHLLARGYYSILPKCNSSKRVHHCSAMLPWTRQAGEGKTYCSWSLLHEASWCYGDMDRGLGWAQPSFRRCFFC